MPPARVLSTDHSAIFSRRRRDIAQTTELEVVQRRCQRQLSVVKGLERAQGGSVGFPCLLHPWTFRGLPGPRTAVTGPARPARPVCRYLLCTLMLPMRPLEDGGDMVRLR